MKTALVLSGGGPKGAFQVGALKVIFKKIIPNAVFGTSVGSVNGTILLSQKNIWDGLDELEYVWLDVTKSLVFPYNKKILLNFVKVESIYSHKGLKMLLKGILKNKRFEDLLLPFYVRCTRLVDGKAIFFNKGDLIEPVVASFSIPPLFPPVEINGQEYIDGGFCGNGLKKVESMGFKQIILINLNNHIKSVKDISIPNLLAASIETLAYNFTKYEIETIKRSKIIEINIDPKYSLDLTDFSLTEELIKAGEKDAKKILGKIKV